MIGAIEAGGTKFVCAVAGADGTIVARTMISTRAPNQTFAEVRAFFVAASAEHGPIEGIGIGSFGPLNLDPASPDYGTFTTTPKPGWRGARWREALAELAAPILVNTDVNAAALGEWSHGAGRGCASVAYTTVGTGIGSGVVHGGQALRGFSHYETGHIPTPHDQRADPFPGSCPYHGDCLEGLVSGTAISARWGKDLTALPPSTGAVELVAGYLAHLAVTLILSHMPERLIFGGGVMKAPGLIESLRRHTQARVAGYVAAPELAGDLAGYIVAPGLGDDAGIVGAVELGRRAAATERGSEGT